jgi:hypothetical protein
MSKASLNSEKELAPLSLPTYIQISILNIINLAIENVIEKKNLKSFF